MNRKRINRFILFTEAIILHLQYLHFLNNKSDFP